MALSLRLEVIGYLPDLQDAAFTTMLQQAVALSSGWSTPRGSVCLRK